MTPIEDILKFGTENGSSPEEIAGVIDLFHTNTAKEIDALPDAEQDRFRIQSKLDDDYNSAVVQLRTDAMNREVVKQFPDPTERQAFLYTLGNIKQENQGESFFPTEYETQARAINAAGEPFKERKRQHGSIDFGSQSLGRYVMRPTGGNSFQFLLETTPEKIGSVKPFASAPKDPVPEYMSKTVEVDRDALVEDSRARVAAYDDPLAFSSEELAAVNGPKLRQEQALLKFRETAPLDQIAAMELVSGLKDDEKFKDRIPNDWVEQFTVRPVAKVVQGFARTAAAVAGDEEMLLEPDPINTLAPGALRNRFENKSGGEAKADLLASGIESLITFLAPGAVAKLGGKVLPLLGRAGEAAITAGSVTGGATAGSIASAGGTGGFLTTSFGNSYSNRLQLAENTTDPVEADRIRAWAPFLALGDAVKEAITERLIPGDVESLISKGLSGSLAKRILNAGVVAPVKEGLEEVAGVGIEQLYQGTPGTPESQNVVEAFKGGFFGGLAFAPAAFFGRDTGKLPDGQTGFNGQVFDTLENAEEARTESLARVEDTLKPEGIITQEDAVAWLNDFERRAATATPEEATLAEQVSALAPLLPAGSPAPVDQTGSGAADTGGDASPVGGIAPAGGVAENLSPAEEVNRENVVGDTSADLVTPTAPVTAAQTVEAPRSAVDRATDIAVFAPDIQYFTPDTSTPEGQVMQQFSTASGAKVVLFEAGPNPVTGKVTDGFVIPGDPNTIYLARNTRQPFLHVLGHEFYHSREEMASYQAFAAEVQRLEPEAWERAKTRFPDNPAKAASEFMADVVGSRFVQKDFWDRLQREMNPGVFRQFVEYVRGLWAKLKTQLGARNVTVQNVQEIDRMLASILPIRPEAGTLGAPVQDVQQTDSVSEATRMVLHPPGSAMAKLSFGNETLLETKPEAVKRTTVRGKEYSFNLSKYRLEDGRERWILHTGEIQHPLHTNVIDAGALFKVTDKGPEIEMLHKGETGFDGLGGALFREITRQYGKPVVAPDAPLSAATERFRPQQSEIQVEPRGFQKGVPGVVEDQDLYNVVAPGSSVDGTTFAVPAGSDQAAVQQRAREKFTEAGELPQSEAIPDRQILISSPPIGDLPVIAAAANDLVAKWQQETGLTPEEICNGNCDEFADQLHKLVGGSIVESQEKGHLWVEAGGYAFDAQDPQGVEGAQNLTSLITSIRQSEYPLNPIDQAALDQGATGTKNAAVEYLRFLYGIEGAKVVTREARDDVLNEAVALVKAKPLYTDNLINKLGTQPQVVGPVDQVVLMMAALESQKASEDAAREVTEAYARQDWVAQGQALSDLADANGRLRKLLDINDATGTLAGRALNFRRYMLQRDYSFVRMEKAFQSAANQGGPLNDQQAAYVKAMSDKIAAQEKRIKELESVSLDTQVADYMEKFFGAQAAQAPKVSPSLSAKEFESRYDTSAQQSSQVAKNWFKSRIKASTIIDGISLSESDPMPPEVRAALVVWGSRAVDKGVDTIDGFRDALVAEFGADAAPFAESTFAAAKELRANLRDKHTARKAKPKPSTQGAVDARKDVAAATQAPAADGTVTTGNEPDRELVRAIVRANVEAGLRGPREVFPAAHADLLPLFPDITEDDIKRIFSNYGKAVFPSKDEIAVEMAELNSIGRLEVTIADLEKGLPALRTGPQRQEATEQIRRLQKQVNELKRKHGFTQRTESQLKGALDAAKTRLRNEIEDLTTFIEAGGRTPEQKAGKTPVAGDPELDNLRKQRDALRTELAALEGPAEVTEAQRIEATIKALKRAEETLTTRLEAGPLVEVPGRAPVTSDEIEERRSYVTTLREMIQEQRNAIRPMAVPFMRALDRAQAALDKVTEIMETGKTPDRPTPQGALTQAEEDLKLEAAAMRRVLAEENKEATRPDRQLKAAEATLERLEALLTAPLTPGGRPETVALSEREEEVRGAILTARKELAALRGDDPAIQLERQKKDIATRTATLKAKLAAGDFSKKKPRPAVTADAALERLLAEYRITQKEWHRQLFEEGLKSRRLPQRIKDFIGEIFKLARIFELGFDFGIILRQGGRTVGRPDIFARAISRGANATGSKVRQEQEWARITGDPQFQLALRMGLEITDPDDIVAYRKEEAFQSRWLTKEFKTGNRAADAVVNAPLGISRALARGQIIAIDTIRFNIWKAMNTTLSRYGAPTEAEMRSYARMANASTGRGSIDAEWERGVGTLFLAYRWAKSGLEYVALRPLWQPVIEGEATVRSTAVIAAEYARNLSGIALFYLAYTMAHWNDDDDKWKIEWDPRSPRFAKLPIGETLVDPTAGMAQWVVLMSKMITGEKKTQAGKIVQLAETEDGKKPQFGQGRGSELLQFLRYKLNPVLGAGINVTTGRDAVGERTSLGREALKLVTPLQFGDIRKAIQANGYPEGVALSILSFFGMSIQTWEEKHKENLSSENRVWLYRNALSIPQLADSATRGDVLGQDADVQKRRGTNKLLTDEERKALLSESLPGVELMMKEAKDRASAIPADLSPEKRAAREHDLQLWVNSRVETIRRRVLRGP